MITDINTIRKLIKEKHPFYCDLFEVELNKCFIVFRGHFTDSTGKFYYDENIGKIVYIEPAKALSVHNLTQLDHANIHKWIESEKHKKDLGESAVIDWIGKYAVHFRHAWRKIHIRVDGNGT